MNMADKIIFFKECEHSDFAEYGEVLIDILAEYKKLITPVFKNKIEVELDNIIYLIKKEKDFVE